MARSLEGLLPGACKVIVSKEKHAEYTNNVEIQPGRETTLEAFLDYQAITYSWDVVRVEIEDRYEVELTITYETNVPMPVVETIMPAKMPFLRPGETYMFSAVLSNKGLIRADDVEFTLPEVFNSQQCAIVFNYPQGSYSLLPQQTVTIPVVATGAPPTRSSECLGYSATLWSWECGFDRKWHRVSKVFSVSGTNCGGAGYGILGGGGGGAPVASGPGSSTSVREPSVPTMPSTDPGCIPCTNGLGVNMTGWPSASFRSSAPRPGLSVATVGCQRERQRILLGHGRPQLCPQRGRMLQSRGGGGQLSAWSGHCLRGRYSSDPRT